MTDLSEPQVLIQLIESLKQASSCCRMLGTMQQRPMFLVYAENLDMMRDLLQKLVASRSDPRSAVHGQLERLRLKRIATQGNA